MKKTLLVIGALSIAFISQVKAQEAESPTARPYNQWSVEAGVGFNKPTHAWNSGYGTELVSPLSFNVGARYMFNEYVGLKAMFSYDKLEEADGSMNFESKFYTGSLEGVVNLGRIMNFQSWTKTINVLGHAGVGISSLAPQTGMYKDSNDKLANFRGGLTGQVKLSDKLVLTGDVSILTNIKQDNTWNGGIDNHSTIQGIMFNGTVGLTYYIGKAKKHADWYIADDVLEGQIASLDGRVTAIEGNLNDADGDGVADYLDKESNSTAGAVVNTLGVTVDKNNDGVIDSSEPYLVNTFAKKGEVDGNENLLAKLMNDGYVSVFFDFNSSKVKSSKDAINFIATYLKQNSSVNAELSGYADGVGSAAYNDKLSAKRAESVKAALVKAGIDASRISTTGQGQIPGDGDYTRKVTVKLK